MHLCNVMRIIRSFCAVGRRDAPARHGAARTNRTPHQHKTPNDVPRNKTPNDTDTETEAEEKREEQQACRELVRELVPESVLQGQGSSYSSCSPPFPTAATSEISCSSVTRMLF